LGTAALRREKGFISARCRDQVMFHHLFQVFHHPVLLNRFAGNAVVAAKPAAKVHIGTAAGAEGAVVGWLGLPQIRAGWKFCSSGFLNSP
jgi:uncharacterized membrane protein